jgi:hypothetical protein
MARFDTDLHLRLEGADVARLERLAQRVPGGRPAPLARELLLRGLAQAEADPAGLVRSPAPPTSLDTAGPIVA